MGLRTLLFALLFAGSAAAALVVPLVGLLGYMAHYIIGPDRQWWNAPLRPYGLRYSFILAASTAIGMVFRIRGLKFGREVLKLQEKLLLALLTLVWVLRLVSEPTVGYTIIDHPSLKLTKVALFVLVLTHLVTEARSLKLLMWLLAISTLLLGVQAYTMPLSAFESARLENVGGADFAEANFLSAFIAGVLPVMGVLFLQSKWPGKTLAVLAGVFSVNAIILTRSRGAVVGIALGGVLAVLMAPRRYRLKIVVGLLVVVIGGVYLADPGFLRRVSTLNRPEEELDIATIGRIETWRASVQMLRDHPLGIGPGNFFQMIGRYNPKYAFRDAHNTYSRCFVELGIPGLVLFGMLIANAVIVARRAMRRALSLRPELRDQILYPAYGFAVGLCMMLCCGLTVTLLYTEAVWWFLMFPTCVERAVDNLATETVPRPAQAGSIRRAIAGGVSRVRRSRNPLRARKADQ